VRNKAKGVAGLRAHLRQATAHTVGRYLNCLLDHPLPHLTDLALIEHKGSLIPIACGSATHSCASCRSLAGPSRAIWCPLREQSEGVSYPLQGAVSTCTVTV
jgi:hypothetical protein